MTDDNAADPDPIKASYDVFINPNMEGTRQLYILQYPNRDGRQKYAAENNSQPLKMRVKPNAGMVELDVPMDVYHNYDRGKGVKWGMATKKSKASHGLPGGFGIGGSTGAPRGRGRGGAEEESIQQILQDDFNDVVEEGKVLLKQTLGGQTVPIEETTPQYMIGTFVNDQLHFTPVDNIVQMRPQFHHIDAQAELEKASRPGAAVAPGAKAIHMVAKSNIDGEEDSSEPMAHRIAAAQQEQWKTLNYLDEEDNEAWETYSKSLFVGRQNNIALERNEIMEKFPALRSNLSDSEYLDTISAPRDPTKLPKAKKKRGGQKGKGKRKEVATVDLVESDSSRLTDTSEEEDGAGDEDGDITMS